LNITDITAIELGTKIKSGEISAADAVNAVYDSIERAHEKLNAYISLVPREAALSQSADVQKRIQNGELDDSPLAGVPFGVKDNICTSDTRTTCASRMLGDFVSPYDATVINRLSEMGMVFTGKLNMDEFAIGTTGETSFFGAVKNPWNMEHVPGGSSSGCAAAVAARLVFCALGSDTGGNLRLPASFCGVTGLRPTYGLVSRYGLVACASSMDQIGPIGRDAADCAALMGIIRGKDVHDSTSLPSDCLSFDKDLRGDVSGKRIALVNEYFGGFVQADVRDSVLAVADVFRGLGAEVENVDLPVADYVLPAYEAICSAETSSSLTRFDGLKYGYRSKNAEGLDDVYVANRSEGFGDDVIRRILLGTFVLSKGNYDDYYVKAMQVRALIKSCFERIFEKYDVVLCPTVPNTAPRINAEPNGIKMYAFTAAVSLAGLPALSLPCGFDGAGLPIGAQLIGPLLSDVSVLDFGYAFQRLTDYHRSAPEVI